MSLKGKVALVTGASRGVGKGIAVQLGQAGATVYITGRTLEDGDTAAPGCLRSTAKEIESRGGHAFPVKCDHTNDAEVEQLFQEIANKQGQLDILVNNAYNAFGSFMANFGKPFWEFPESVWDDTNGVGLRNHYLCAIKAAKIMTKQKSGLIVNISGPGGKTYMFTPSYGIGKSGCDRMAADCGLELKSHNVAFISLWPGAVMTEVVQSVIDAIKAGKTLPGSASTETLDLGHNPLIKAGYPHRESPEFVGKCVVALLNDPKLMERSGKMVKSAEIGREFGLQDIDGTTIDELDHDAYMASIGISNQ